MKELLQKYRDKAEYDLSCSEAILYAANEYYSLNLDQNSMRMMAPFSGGMLEGDTCGIMSASIAVLGIIFTNNVAHDSAKLYEAVLEYKALFRKVYTSQCCDVLVNMFSNEESGCSDFIVEAGSLLTTIIEKYNK